MYENQMMRNSSYANSIQPFETPQYYYSPMSVRNDIHWVQGISGAKAHYVEPGRSILLMDSEENKFYIKSTDGMGRPLPLRSFRYNEEMLETVDTRQSGSSENNKYITKDDFNKILEEKLNMLKKDLGKE